jgi:glutathione synthase/RimK-type ligase-like ATP-grasp enzyme
MTEPSAPEPRALVLRLLESYCARNGLRLSAADPHGHAGLVEGPGGQRWFFKGTRFDLNTQGAAEIANDKAYAAHFLKAAGLNVPAGLFVPASELRGARHLPKHVLDFAEEKAYPLFVKPNCGREGRDVMRAGNPDDLLAALTGLANRHDQLLVQEEVRGTELRVLLLDGETLCAIERHPPRVTGDGRRSLGELLKAVPAIDAGDERIAAELTRQDLTQASVPAAGRIVTLLPVANLSAGGTARIATSEIASEVAEIARRAVETLALRYAAVDLILSDPPRLDTAVVLEVNAAPGLANLHRLGETEARQVEEIYERVFAAMVEA